MNRRLQIEEQIKRLKTDSRLLSDKLEVSRKDGKIWILGVLFDLDQIEPIIRRRIAQIDAEMARLFKDLINCPNEEKEDYRGSL